MRIHIQVKNSYNIWSPTEMKKRIIALCGGAKSYGPLVVEWWLHNIGYYMTRRYIDAPRIKALNERFKHVDLMVDCEEKI